jgi:uncharacterized delta-60 repeat protein
MKIMHAFAATLLEVFLLTGCGEDIHNQNADQPSNQESETQEVVTTFADNGVVTHHNAAGGEWDDFADDMAIDASGRIVAVGESKNSSGSYDLVVWRFLPSGEIDTSFGSNKNGVVTYPVSAGGFIGASAVVIDAAGNIVITGHRTGTDGTINMAIWRYKENGSLDTSFGNNGLVEHHNAAQGNGNDNGNDLLIDHNGKIIVAGQSEGSFHYDLAVWRYNNDGSLDTTFNSTGYNTVNDAAGGNGYDTGRSVGLDSQGRIVIAGGSIGSTGTNDIAIWRFDANGQLDQSFGTGGIVSHHDAAGGNGDEEVHALVIDPQDNIFVTAYSDRPDTNLNAVVLKYNDLGVLDTAFGSSGVLMFENLAGGDGWDYPQDMILDGLGNIYLAGMSKSLSNGFDMFVLKFDKETASLDTGFENQGLFLFDGSNHGYDRANSIAFDSAGNLLILGYTEASSSTTYYDLALIQRLKQ